MKSRQTAPIVTPVQQARRKPYAICDACLQPPQNIQRLLRFETMRQHQDEKLTFCEFQEISELQVTISLLGVFPPLSASE